MNVTVVFFLVMYYVVLLGIGFWAMRRGASKDLEGYLLGGRNVGPMVTNRTPIMASVKATAFLADIASLRNMAANMMAKTTVVWLSTAAMDALVYLKPAIQKIFARYAPRIEPGKHVHRGHRGGDSSPHEEGGTGQGVHSRRPDSGVRIHENHHA